MILAAAFCTGRKHDFQLFQESGIKLPPHVLLLADAGYQGVVEIHPNSQTPFKKTKLHPLDKEQKTSNRTLSRKRIAIEHIFRKHKVFRILSERSGESVSVRFSMIAAVYGADNCWWMTYARGLLLFDDTVLFTDKQKDSNNKIVLIHWRTPCE